MQNEKCKKSKCTQQKDRLKHGFIRIYERTEKETESPLASRLRPTTLDEMVGQQHIIGKDKLLYRAIKADKLSSIILYGPPGTGKTTLAKVIANSTSAEFLQMNATSAGKKDMEDVIAKAKNNMGMFGKRRSCLSTRSIVLIRDSRIIFCRSWKMEPSS